MVSITKVSNSTLRSEVARLGFNESWSRLAMWLAWCLPKRVAYWAAIRVAAYATMGEWGKESPDSVSIMSMLKRWDKK